KLTESSAGDAPELVLSLEMFERDIQPIIDEYLDDLITEDQLRKDARAWNNYQSDYSPLVVWAKENHLDVIAANAPRRYVSLVGRRGRDALLKVKAPADRGLPPLPYAEASPAYAKKFRDIMKKMREKMRQKAKDDSPKQEREPQSAAGGRTKGSGDALDAQSLWDATMAYSIAERLMAKPESRVFHVCGSFHVADSMGIPEHLLRYRPGTRLFIVNIAATSSFPTADADDPPGQADFVILTDGKLPRTFDAMSGE
ncbi:MAG: ChaN family lipoprotein, partial [Planctomycetota bacterium]